MAAFKDLTGKRFGRLLVCHRSFLYVETSRATYWLCKCDCGTYTITRGASLIRGATKSCGCIRAEKSRETIKIYGNKLGRKPKKIATQS